MDGNFCRPLIFYVEREGKGKRLLLAVLTANGSLKR